MRDEIIFTAEGRINTKKERVKECKKTSYSAGVPISYKSNNTREELCLEYIQSFLEQYKKIYPKRKKPYMITDNEYGLRKFVCSSIRPSQISFSELYDMYECSTFLAGYILYGPLDPPTKPPRVIFSPTETLKRHTGDSFDLSTLLCSLLIGSGYDAYVVCGYAPRHVTLRDQSSTQCPIIATLNDSIAKAKLRSEEEQQLDIEESSYIPLDNSVKTSFYIADQLERKRVDALDTFELWIPDPPPANTSSSERGNKAGQSGTDFIDGELRQHAWVMVCAGRREVKDTVFFESSTGRVYSTGNSPYTGVDSVWNHRNFWVINSLDMRVADIDFDLSKDDNWESLFPQGISTTGDDSSSAAAMGDDDHEDMMEEKKKDRPTTVGVRPEPGSEVGRTFENPPSWVSPISLERTKYLMR
jgi:hypothetical protein